MVKPNTDGFKKVEMKKLIKTVLFELGDLKRTVQLRSKTKIFCIGQNKTGTTSLKKSFLDLGYKVGRQRAAEELLMHYKLNDFVPIIRYCKTAQVFQDVPFSLPETFVHLDKAFPNSKFILTVRDSSEQWYNSITKFHSKIFGKGELPDKSALEKSNYVWKGWAWDCMQILYKAAPHTNPYQKNILINAYEEYNKSVIDFFRNRPNDLIVINLNEKGSYSRLMEFLNIQSPYKDFPWENETKKLNIK